MQLVSPMLNDALALAGVPGAAFLNEFQAADARERRWVARRSLLPGLRSLNLTARRSAGAIIAEATLAPGVFLDETGQTGLLRVPAAFPDSVDAALPGRLVGAVIGHPLTSRPTSSIVKVTLSADELERIISYTAALEPLR